jgi:molybdate transport system substrate-binding protein
MMITGILLVCSTNAIAAEVREITISAAMSLKNAFEELGERYEAEHKGVKIRFNFGSSGGLRTQIEGGAPIDAFAAASHKDMDELEKRGLVVPGSRVDFASNAVVLVAPLKAKPGMKSFTDLESKEIKRIAMGNPKTVPAGGYAEEVLHYYKVGSVVRDKLIFAENVRQVLDYVVRGEVDAGIVYATDCKTRTKEITIASIAPWSSHERILYPFALIKGTKNEGPARRFISLTTSAEGTEILRKYGFIPAQQKTSR